MPRSALAVSASRRWRGAELEDRYVAGGRGESVGVRTVIVPEAIGSLARQDGGDGEDILAGARL